MLTFDKSLLSPNPWILTPPSNPIIAGDARYPSVPVLYLWMWKVTWGNIMSALIVIKWLANTGAWKLNLWHWQQLWKVCLMNNFDFALGDRSFSRNTENSRGQQEDKKVIESSKQKQSIYLLVCQILVARKVLLSVQQHHSIKRSGTVAEEMSLK